MSPEIYQCGVEGIDGFEGEEHYGYEVDMWAFGVVFFFLLNKSYPFGKINIMQKYNRTGVWNKR